MLAIERAARNCVKESGISLSRIQLPKIDSKWAKKRNKSGIFESLDQIKSKWKVIVQTHTPVEFISRSSVLRIGELMGSGDTVVIKKPLGEVSCLQLNQLAAGFCFKKVESHWRIISIETPLKMAERQLSLAKKKKKKLNYLISMNRSTEREDAKEKKTKVKVERYDSPIE